MDVLNVFQASWRDHFILCPHCSTKWSLLITRWGFSSSFLFCSDVLTLTTPSRANHSLLYSLLFMRCSYCHTNSLLKSPVSRCAIIKDIYLQGGYVRNFLENSFNFPAGFLWNLVESCSFGRGRARVGVSWIGKVLEMFVTGWMCKL